MFPNSGPIQRVPPGVSDSFGTTAGSLTGEPSVKRCCSIMPRARNCGSANMSATL